MASAEVNSRFSDPVLGGDANSFFFVLTELGSPPVAYASTWNATAHTWSTGVPIPELAVGDAGSPMRATGASSDGLTLFFFHDGVSGNERAAWRVTVTSPFTQFVDEIPVPQAAPNFGCTTLYFQGSDSTGSGAFVAQ